MANCATSLGGMRHWRLSGEFFPLLSWFCVKNSAAGFRSFRRAETISIEPDCYSAMNLPVQVTFRHMEPSAAVEARIRDEAAALDRYFSRITSCRVVVEAPGRRGKGFHISIDIGVPGSEIAVNHDASLHGAAMHGEKAALTKTDEAEAEHKDVYVALRDAFDAARRQLADYAEKLRGEVKRHEQSVR
jgi:ribosome-associated translation inhibitor RaiA